MTAALRVGVVGLGAMGLPIALRLLETGHRTVVYARTRAASRPAAAAGAFVARTSAELACGVDVVVLCLPSGDSVRDVAFGRSGFTSVNAVGAVVVDTSTIAPSEARSIGGQLAASGIAYLDAPVSGGTEAAAAGTLSIMAGGEAKALERARPALESIAAQIGHVGPLGSGQVCKACNQLLVLGTIELVAEALTLAARSDIDPARVRDLLLGGYAASRVLDRHGERMLSRDFAPGGRARFNLKDVAIVEELARAAAMATPSFDAAARRLEALVDRGGGDLDSAALITVAEAGA